jgi:hypothetical protein
MATSESDLTVSEHAMFAVVQTIKVFHVYLALPVACRCVAVSVAVVLSGMMLLFQSRLDAACRFGFGLSELQKPVQIAQDVHISFAAFPLDRLLPCRPYHVDGSRAVKMCF